MDNFKTKYVFCYMEVTHICMYLKRIYIFTDLAQG